MYIHIYTGEVGIVERNCKYNRLALPGIVFMCWPFESLKSRVSLRVMQLDIRAETKTLDNVFVLVSFAQRFRVGAWTGRSGCAPSSTDAGSTPSHQIATRHDTTTGVHLDPVPSHPREGLRRRLQAHLPAGAGARAYASNRPTDQTLVMLCWNRPYPWLLDIHIRIVSNLIHVPPHHPTPP